MGKATTVTEGGYDIAATAAILILRWIINPFIAAQYIILILRWLLNLSADAQCMPLLFRVGCPPKCGKGYKEVKFGRSAPFSGNGGIGETLWCLP